MSGSQLLAAAFFVFGAITVLYIRKGNKDNVVTPPFEKSHQDNSNEESQHLFSLRNKKHYL